MAQSFYVSGGQGGTIPGTLGPGGIDGRLEWVPAPHGGDLVGAIAARLGSPADPERVILAAIAPLAPWLEGPALEAIQAALPWPLARTLLRAEEFLLEPIPRATGAGDWLATVARIVRRPLPSARAHALAVLGAVRETLSPEASRAVEGRLPPDLADLWAAAR
jgi:uncharacterized protein (DUF2267 family)